MATRKKTIVGRKSKKKRKKPTKKVLRDNRGKLLPGTETIGSGSRKGTFSLRTMLHKALLEQRGNRPAAEMLVKHLVDAAILGDNRFNTAPAKLIFEHIDGKPTQKIVADITNRDGYRSKSDEELLRIAGIQPCAPGEARKAEKEQERIRREEEEA